MNRITVDLFVEDRAHEAFLGAMIGRLAQEEDQDVVIRVRAARGGHGRALDELDGYRRLLEKAVVAIPDLIVVAIDANCKKPGPARKEIHSHIVGPLQGKTIIACPDPHIERWFLADPASFALVVGIQPKVGKRKCRRDLYKNILTQAIRDAGHLSTLGGGVEFALDLVLAMNLPHAAKNEPTLGRFIGEMRSAIRRIALTEG